MNTTTTTDAPGYAAALYRHYSTAIFTLVADDEVVWSGDLRPVPATIDSVCRTLERMGWNGTTLELRRNSEFVMFVSPTYL